MISFLETFLPIVIYILLIVLLIVGIILGIRSIQTLNKLDVVIDDVDKKVKTLDGIFNVIDIVSNKFSFVTNKVVDGISGLVGKIFNRSKVEDDFFDDEEE